MSDDWQRMTRKTAFCAAFCDRELVGDGLRFTIHSDGRLSGLADGVAFSGVWFWQDGYFCRSAQLNGEDLGQDCETIEQLGNRMRYTRNKGRGAASIVALT